MFSREHPESHPSLSSSSKTWHKHRDALCASGWKSVVNERKLFDSKHYSGFYNKFLFESMTRNYSLPKYRGNDDLIWSELEIALHASDSLLAFKPIWEAYNNRLLEGLSEDNVQYAELRSLMDDTYDLDGNVYGKEDFLKDFARIVKSFQASHPDFIGVRIIGCTVRNLDVKDLVAKLEEASKLMKLFPHLYVGFDLVGREDTGQSLQHFHKYLIDAEYLRNVTFFFHGGETGWSGTQVDYNLFDAILLHTHRIGHGVAFSKHPYLMKVIKERDIPIEVCPISNQALGYVSDMRSHPASLFVKTNVSFVISSDDPSLWDIEGLSYDWYEAFIGLDATLSLGFLKTMAVNSLQFSALTNSEKKVAVAKWEKKWNEFIAWMIK